AELHLIDGARLRPRHNASVVRQLTDTEAWRRSALAAAVPGGECREADDVVADNTIGRLQRFVGALELIQVEMTDDAVEVRGPLRARDRLRVLIDLDLDALCDIDEAQVSRSEEWQQAPDIDRIGLAAVGAQIV